MHPWLYGEKPWWKDETTEPRKVEREYLKLRCVKLMHARYTSRILLDRDKLMSERWRHAWEGMKTERTFWQPTQSSFWSALLGTWTSTSSIFVTSSTPASRLVDALNSPSADPTFCPRYGWIRVLQCSTAAPGIVTSTSATTACVNTGVEERCVHRWSVTWAQPLRLILIRCGQWANTPSIAVRPKLPYEMSKTWSSGSFFPLCRASRAVSSRYLQAESVNTWQWCA